MPTGHHIIEYKRIFCVTIFVLTALLSHSQIAENGDKKGEFESSKILIEQLINIKKQNPDSFFKNRLDYKLAMTYFSISDTVNFISVANTFLYTGTSEDLQRIYRKSTLCKILYRISQAQRDTMKILDYGEKRLFIYNRLKCGTGEREFRIQVFDQIINIYNAKGLHDKVKELKKVRLVYLKTEKLKMPKYLVTLK